MIFRKSRTFKIKKKSGDYRAIHSPIKGLKSIQKTLNFVLQCVFTPHYAAMGFVRDKSIVDNAKLHEGSKYVYNIDLKDFFQSVDQARVWKCLQLKPFNLCDGFPLNIEPENSIFWFCRTSTDELQNENVITYFLFDSKFKKGTITLELENVIRDYLCKSKLKIGIHTLKLENGNKLIYKINTSDIVIFKKHSDINYITQKAISLQNDTKYTLEKIFDRLIIDLISNHQKSILQHNRKYLVS